MKPEWRDRRHRRHEAQRDQERARVEGQRRWLESQLDHQAERERALAFEAALETLKNSADPAQRDQLSEILAAGGDAEQWRLLRQLCEALVSFSGQAQTQLLAVISARPKRLSQAVGKSRSQLLLTGLDFSALDFAALNLRGATISHCRFDGAQLPGLDLYGARLEQVDFRQADLDGANLTGTTLNQVDFSGARLSDAQLVSAELIDCRFEHTDLSRAILRQSRWAGGELQGARFDQVVGMPAGLKARVNPA